MIVACSTHGSFEDAVVDVVGAALGAGEGELFAVLVALLVRELERNSKHVLCLILPLVLLLRAEVTRVQAWLGHRTKKVFQPCMLSFRDYC